MGDIYVLGDINADLTTDLDAYPVEGDDSEIVALHWLSGGVAANTATALALLGGQVKLLGRVGHDPSAAVALRAAAAAGVDLSAVQRDPTTATGLCIAAISPDGQRTFLSFRGANVALDGSDWTTASFGIARSLHVGAHSLLEGAQQQAALRAIELAFANGLVVSLDLCAPAIRRQPALLQQLLPSVTLLLMNETELQLLHPGLDNDNALDTLMDMGIPFVVLKRGAAGCTIVTPTSRLDLMSLPVVASDTNGCGDAFAAGFLWGYLHDAPLLGCAALGNLLGGLTATRPGAADALPSAAEIRSALHHYPQWIGSATVQAFLTNLEL